MAAAAVTLNKITEKLSSETSKRKISKKSEKTAAKVGFKVEKYY